MRRFIILLLAVVGSGVVWAGEFEDGYAAYLRKDYAEAVRLYRLAAQQGIATPQNNLGVAFEKGQGVPQDYAEAVRWYRLAAQQGFALAQYNLGMMYATGKGVSQDYVLAHLWFNLAAASGDVDAIKNRDMAAALMAPHQIAAAHMLARECTDKELKDCD